MLDLTPIPMRKLETAGYVDVEKTFVDRLPLTVYRITKAGLSVVT